MDRRNFIAVALVAAALSIPTTAATWGSTGGYEPDTAFDKTDGRMFQTPDTTAAGRSVYFNGFYADRSTVNPNLAATGTGIFAGNVMYFAQLGVWADCNKDGYIGMAENAIADYLVAAGQHDATACPATPRGVSDLPVHNDGTWIKEFIPIGTADPCSFQDVEYRRTKCNNVGGFSRNPDVLYSNHTFVWVDHAAPGEVSAATCPITPFPRGTTSSTGGLLYYGDCFIGRRIANTVNAGDAAAGGNTGLRFEDPNVPQKSSSKLNQEFPVSVYGNPFHSQKTGVIERYDPTNDSRPYRPAFTTADCSSTRTDVRDPTAPEGSNGTLNQVGVKAPAGTPAAVVTSQGYLIGSANITDNRGVILGVYGVKPSVRDPVSMASQGGSAWAGLTDANDGVYANFQAQAVVAGGVTGPNYQTRTAGDCDRSTNNTVHNNWAFGQGESEFEPVGGDIAKTASSDRMNWVNGFRGIGNGLVGGNAGNTIDDVGGTHTWPTDAGVNRRVLIGPSWNAIVTTVVSHQGFNRNTLQAHPAFYRTFYANVNATTITEYSLLLPNASPAVYGAEHCGTAIGPDQPNQKSWACDPAKWNRNPNTGAYAGVNYADGSRVSRQVGDPYNLRDVDCYDGSLGRETDKEGIYASAVALNGGPCKR